MIETVSKQQAEINKQRQEINSTRLVVVGLSKYTTLVERVTTQVIVSPSLAGGIFTLEENGHNVWFTVTL